MGDEVGDWGVGASGSIMRIKNCGPDVVPAVALYETRGGEATRSGVSCWAEGRSAGGLESGRVRTASNGRNIVIADGEDAGGQEARDDLRWPQSRVFVGQDATDRGHQLSYRQSTPGQQAAHVQVQKRHGCCTLLAA